MLNIRDAIYANAAHTKINVTLDHPEHGTIPYTFDPATTDRSCDAEVRLALLNLTVAPFIPYVPSQAEVTASQIKAAKVYLAETDWVVAKIAEAQLQGQVITGLLTQYTTELTARENARALINTLEIT